MRRLLNSLVFRVGVLFLLGAMALQLALFAVVLWPDERPLVFRLIDPSETRQIVEALEAVRPDQQEMIIAAVNNGAVVATLLPSFVEQMPEGEHMRRDTRIERQFAQFAHELGGRRYRIDLRRTEPAQLPQAPVRLVVELRTGQALAIERTTVVITAIASRYFAIAGVIGAVLLVIMLVLTSQVIRPVSRLAAGVDAFREEMRADDVVPKGAAELRELAIGFNAMKHQIGTLVADRTRILAAVAHDLRTYLTRLRLRADYIEDGEQRAKAASDIAEMGQLLDDVLLFAHDQTSEEAPAPVIDARAETINYVQMRCELGDAVTLTAGDAPVLCRCAPLAFRRILGNLIDNAIRYGKIAKVGIAGNQAVVLTVADEGPGIPPEHIERLTQPFERLDPSRSRRTGGAGLGLAIVKALAETHAMTIELENRIEGGLCVTVRCHRPMLDPKWHANGFPGIPWRPGLRRRLCSVCRPARYALQCCGRRAIFARMHEGAHDVQYRHRALAGPHRPCGGGARL